MQISTAQCKAVIRVLIIISKGSQREKEKKNKKKEKDKTSKQPHTFADRNPCASKASLYPSPPKVKEKEKMEYSLVPL